MFPVLSNGIRGSFCGLAHCQKDKEGITFLEAPGNQEGRTFYRVHVLHVAVSQLKGKPWPANLSDCAVFWGNSEHCNDHETSQWRWV